MTSPSRDPVQEARDILATAVGNLCRLPLGAPDTERDALEDAYDRARKRYRAALRASLVERVVEKVEGMRKDTSPVAAAIRLGREGYNKALDDVLAVLRAELSEGRTK